MISAVIFDMDGLLVDTEPLWRQAEKEVFREVGLDLTDEMLVKVMGYRIDEVVKYWYNFKPWEAPSLEEMKNRVLTRVEELIREKAGPMTGTKEVLETIAAKGIPMALASSSPNRVIRTVLEKFDIRFFFQFIHSAEEEKYGKPHPGIYINTARQLKVEPENCLAIEDSFNGLLAAKSARMKTIVIPSSENPSLPKFSIADFNLRTLKEINDSFLESL